MNSILFRFILHPSEAGDTIHASAATRRLGHRPRPMRPQGDRLQEIDGQIVATAFDYIEHPEDPQPARRRSRSAHPRGAGQVPVAQHPPRRHRGHQRARAERPGPLRQAAARRGKEDRRHRQVSRPSSRSPSTSKRSSGTIRRSAPASSTDGFAMETEIGLFAMKRDMVSRYLQHFKDVDVEVHVVQMAPLALCNFVAYDLLGKDGRRRRGRRRDKKCVVALDIGTDSSNLVITDGERIIWQRPIPLGGNHFTRALTKDLKLTFAKAEHLKRNATKSPDLKKILACPQAGAQRFRRRSAALARLLHQHAPRRPDSVHGRPGQRLPLARLAEVPRRRSSSWKCASCSKMERAQRRSGRRPAGVHREHPDASPWPTAWLCKGSSGRVC